MPRVCAHLPDGPWPAWSGRAEFLVGDHSEMVAIPVHDADPAPRTEPSTGDHWALVDSVRMERRQATIYVYEPVLDGPMPPAP